MSVCPCPKHPFGCRGHPHECGCADIGVASDEAVKRAVAELKDRGAPLPFTEDMRAALTAAYPALVEEVTRLREALDRALREIDEFGSSRVRDRLSARLEGCSSADILHDALQQEVRRARSALTETKKP